MARPVARRLFDGLREASWDTNGFVLRFLAAPAKFASDGTRRLPNLPLSSSPVPSPMRSLRALPVEHLAIIETRALREFESHRVPSRLSEGAVPASRSFRRRLSPNIRYLGQVHCA